eukprot:11183286-Alexandrium_andersonii.AAC.1
MRLCVSRITAQRDRLNSCVFIMHRSHARASTLACPERALLFSGRFQWKVQDGFLHLHQVEG